MVVFDNSIFCLTLHPDAKPRSSVDRVQDRIEHLLQTLRDNKEVAILPTPALSEFLVFAGKSAPEYLVKIRESSFLRIEPFDERAAIELADREISAREKGNKRGSANTSDWQKVKFDRQIVAVALVHKASTIYSDDPDIAAHGKDCGVACFLWQTYRSLHPNRPQLKKHWHAKTQLLLQPKVPSRAKMKRTRYLEIGKIP